MCTLLPSSSRNLSERPSENHTSRESGFVQVWNDRTAGKTLFHEHLDEEHYQFTGGVLMDYKKQFQWTWKYNREQKQVYDCTLAKMPNSTDPQICLLNHADLHSKGFLGKDYPVDFYREQGQTITHFVDFWATLESGSQSLVVAQRGVAKNKITGVSYHQQVNIYNLVTTPIDPNVFTVPPSCPGV